ncbi:hypothetical protein ACOMHN_011576 [Nucella lapillus]
MRILEEVHKEVGHRRRAYWCLKNWDNKVQSRLYEVYMLGVMLLLPLSVMSFSYVSICKELWVMSSLRSTMATRGQNMGSDQGGSFAEPTKTTSTASRGFLNGASQVVSGGGKGTQARFTFRSSPQTPPSSQSASPYRAPTERSPVIRLVRKTKIPAEDDRTRKQVIKMLVAVIAIFVLCWAPILISNVLTAFQVLHHLNYGYLKPLRQAFYLMAYANSCVNPLIYGFMSRHFRQTFLHAICTCLKGREYARSMFLQRQNSCVTRSSHVGYAMSKASSDLELTALDNCTNCVSSAAAV